MRPRQSVQPRRRPKIQQQQLQLGRKHKPDYWLLIWCAALLSIGLIVVYAISPALAVTNHVSSNYYVGKQLIAIVLSIVVFILSLIHILGDRLIILITDAIIAMSKINKPNL